jgi:hypothetical protein
MSISAPLKRWEILHAAQGDAKVRNPFPVGVEGPALLN